MECLGSHIPFKERLTILRPVRNSNWPKCNDGNRRPVVVSSRGFSRYFSQSLAGTGEHVFYHIEFHFIVTLVHEVVYAYSSWPGINEEDPHRCWLDLEHELGKHAIGFICNPAYNNVKGCSLYA